MRAAFKVHRLNGIGMEKARMMAEAFDRLADQLHGMVPAGREGALFTTHLELACFYAKKAMAQDEVNQEPK